MKKIKAILVLAFVLLIMSAISCVSAKKYRELQITSRQNMMDRDDFKTENMKLQMQNRELELRSTALEKEMGDMQFRLAAAETERNRAREELNIISERLNDMQNAHQDLIRGNVNETKRLLAELISAQEDLRKKENILRFYPGHNQRSLMYGPVQPP